MKKRILLKRSNAVITLVSVSGIIVIINLLSSQWFGRIDLTANNLNSLSPYSVEIMRELGEGEGDGELLVKVYASRNLPDREKTGHGMERDIRGVQQKLRDILEEYRARADGGMTIEYFEDDIETRADDAGLKPFVGEKTELTEGDKGRFEMKQYYLGLTLHYRGVMEVIPKALEPGLYEYEITRAVIRLRDKVTEQRRLEDMFRVADELKDLVDRCHEQVTAFTPSEDGEEQLSGIEGLLKPIENLEQEAEALVRNRALVDEACASLLPRFKEIREDMAGEHRRFDAFLTGDTHDEKLKGGVEGLAYAAQKLVEVLGGEEPTPKTVGQWKDVIAKVKGDLDDYHKELRDSAGQQKLGFLCGRMGFCPVPSEIPIFSEDALRMASMRNQQFAQILQYQAGMEQQLRQLQLKIRNQLFRRQDFDVARVEAGAPVPEEIKALVIFGVRGDFSPADRYWIDQYLLSGGTVIVFASRFDVNLGLFSRDSYMKADRRRPRSPDRYDITAAGSSVQELLAPWGVTVEPALVLDPTHTGKISLPHVVRRNNMEFQGTKDFEYPLLVHTTELDQESVMVRSLPGLVLPFASPLSFEAPEGADLDAAVLVTTSDQAVAFPNPDRYWTWRVARDAEAENADELRGRAWESWTEAFGGEPGEGEPPKLELVPTSQVDLAARMDGAAPRTLVLLVEGEFPSGFADGEGLPEGLDDEQRARRLVSGPGRLLVVGSDLGLRLPDPEWVFEGVDPADFVPGPEMVRPQLRVDNWQLRIGQVGRALSIDGIPFLLNTLDWAVQRAALADIRAKQNPLRRIRALESERARTLIEVAWIGGLPLLFLSFGLVSWQWRRVRRRRLRDRFMLTNYDPAAAVSGDGEEVS